MHELIDSLMSLFGTIDYWAVFWLMVMESSILPVPSELVMIPAGVNAANGLLDPYLVVLVGGIGSVCGALVNYSLIGMWLGRPFLEKYGRYILITEHKYKKTEHLFLKNDQLYTFIGRLIPVVRHLISIPAGIFRMPIVPFIVITFLGGTLWCALLVAIGYFVGPQMIGVIRLYGNEIGYTAIILIGVYIWYKIFRKTPKKHHHHSD